jgi:hypothetical protein
MTLRIVFPWSGYKNDPEETDETQANKCEETNLFQVGFVLKLALSIYL